MPALTPLLLGAALLLTPAAASADPTQSVRISPGTSMVVAVAQRLTAPYTGLLSENISVEGDCSAEYAYSPGNGDAIEITAHGEIGQTCEVGYVPHDPQTNELAPAELAGTISVSIEDVPVPVAPAPQPSPTEVAVAVDVQPMPAPPEEPRWRHPVVPVAALAVLGLGAALALGLRREGSI